VRATTPLVVSISRMTEQKGFDLILKADELARLDAQYVFLGEGDPRYVEALQTMARRFSTKFVVRLAYDEPLARRLLAGGDLLLMPSRFEPCGLTQLHGYRYGTIPIVRATGGLDDTVVDYDEKTRTGTGFKFAEYEAPVLAATVKRALACYRHKEAWDDLVARAMRLDFTWKASARRYAEIYARLLGAAAADRAA
jgi:starch synthase